MRKKYWIIARDDDFSASIKNLIAEKFKSFALIADQENPDVVISVGGDGTFLRSIHQYLHCLDRVSFVGVRTGTLGFYTDYRADDLAPFFHDILEKEGSFCPMPLLEINVNNKTFYALNEVRVENNISTLTIDVEIDQQFLERFRGNGLIVCTATGSSAYNRSLGGPIIDHRAEVMCLSEIAGIHHNAYRALNSSLVLNGDRKITLTLGDYCCNVFGLDHLVINEKVQKMSITLSSIKARVLRFKDNTFIPRIRNTLVDS